MRLATWAGSGRFRHRDLRVSGSLRAQAPCGWGHGGRFTRAPRKTHVNEDIGQRLLDARLIDKNALDKAAIQQEASRVSIVGSLVKTGAISQGALLGFLSRRY